MLIYPPPLPPNPTISDRFAQMIVGMSIAVGAKMPRDQSRAPVLILLWWRLQRLKARFLALAARARAGPLPPPRTRQPGTRPRPGPGPGPGPLPGPGPGPGPEHRKPQQRLPHKLGWLVAMLGWEVNLSNLLQKLLADPEMQELLRNAPQAGRLLRPLCRMLGVQPDPKILPPPPPRPPRVRPAPPDLGKIGPDPAAPVPTEPAEKPFRKRPLRTEARTRKPKWTYPGTEWRKWGGFWFPEPIRKPA